VGGEDEGLEEEEDEEEEEEEGRGMTGVMALGTRPLMFQKKGGREGGRCGARKVVEWATVVPWKKRGTEEGRARWKEGNACGRRSRRVAL
jgi:hypothetical protein